MPSLLLEFSFEEFLHFNLQVSATPRSGRLYILPCLRIFCVGTRSWRKLEHFFRVIWVRVQPAACTYLEHQALARPLVSGERWHFLRLVIFCCALCLSCIMLNICNDITLWLLLKFSQNELDKCQVSFINCMALKQSQAIFTEIAAELGFKAPTRDPQKFLEGKFTSSGPMRWESVIIIDSCVVLGCSTDLR